jgi:hypothetical protein
MNIYLVVLTDSGLLNLAHGSISTIEFHNRNIFRVLSYALNEEYAVMYRVHSAIDFGMLLELTRFQLVSKLYG